MNGACFISRITALFSWCARCPVHFLEAAVFEESTLTKRITHYTLQEKAVCHGEHAVFSCLKVWFSAISVVYTSEHF